MHPLLQSVNLTPIVERDPKAVMDDILADHPPVRRCKVLFINATKGIQYYPAIIDYFAALKQAFPQLHVTSASYFDDIFEYGRGIQEKGVPSITIEQLGKCSLQQLNGLDIIIAIGPSTAFSSLIATQGLTAKLVMIDLAFYHQLIELAHQRLGTWDNLKTQALLESQTLLDVEPHNHVLCYSCQSERKITRDLHNSGMRTDPQLWTWRWFSYIPIAFHYRRYYTADKLLFDIAFLGAINRNYQLIDKKILRNKKILFIGKPETTAAMQQHFADIDITYIDKVPEDTYYQLLATCRSILIPYEPVKENCFLSVSDPLAAGIPLLTTEHVGIERMQAEGAPVLFYNEESLADLISKIANDDAFVQTIQQQSRDYCRTHLRIEKILSRISRELLV